MDPKNISINDYDYILPQDKIAKYPLAERDQSKLLIWADEKVSEDIYKSIANHLPAKSLLIFNDTKVIKARILFTKNTGGIIEIFCLEPYVEKGAFEEQNYENLTTMNTQGSVRWKCLIGGASKWKSGPLKKTFFVKKDEVILKAELIQKLPNAYVAELSWKPEEYSFPEIIEEAGEMPLPPYINRKADEEDKQRYQTIYGRHNGSVAAPTAGLHFTPQIFSSLKDKNIQADFVTLHVGAGTFKPVKASSMGLHEMHAEWFDVSAETVEKIMNYKDIVIPVGTTSLRTIESLYWMGLKAFINSNCSVEELEIKQWDVYEQKNLMHQLDAATALKTLSGWMKKNNVRRIIAKTQILIVPGYKFKIAKGLITNFHQPKSTLLLLVAAAIGNNWKKVYNYALKNEFRFLSYGDGCLLFFDQ